MILLKEEIDIYVSCLYGIFDGHSLWACFETFTSSKYSIGALWICTRSVEPIGYLNYIQKTINIFALSNYTLCVDDNNKYEVIRISFKKPKRYLRNTRK